MTRDARGTRDRLLEAGTHLFANRGIDGVTVREINRVAGQRNSSALHYHFGSRDGLLDAILTEHRGPIETRRIALLDRLEQEGRTHDLRALVETIVLPFGAELATRSGRDYLRILPQMIGRYGMSVGRIPESFGPDGYRRALRYAHASVPHLPAPVRWERVSLAMEVVTYAIARRAHDIECSEPLRVPEETYVTAVVDLAVGGLLAPVGVGSHDARP